MKRLLCLISALFLSVPGAAADDPQGPEERSVSWITLGTGGGPVIRVQRGQPANALVVGDHIYLFDIGAGTLAKLAAAGLDTRKIRAVFLSHHHIDHTGDLAPFLIDRWVLSDYDPIQVIGPPGTRSAMGAVVALNAPVALAPVTIGGPEKPYIHSTWEVTELADLHEPREIFCDENVCVIAVSNSHYNFTPGSDAANFSRSYSFRVESGDKSYVYTGDTGPSANLVSLAKGADVLISEVIDMEAIDLTLRQRGYPVAALAGLLAHMREDHLTPVEVGRLAASAGVGRVILTHLVPGNDDEVDLSGYLDGISDAFDGPVSIASDLERF